MQIISALALLAATSNALAIQDDGFYVCELVRNYAHDACGMEDGYEDCRERVYIEDITTDAEYQDCLAEANYADEQLCGNDEDCLDESSQREDEVKYDFQCLLTDECGCPE